MKAKVMISKSFDNAEKVFTKEWEQCDFKEFFVSEGGYLDRLAETLNSKGIDGDSFTVTYTVTLTK